MKLLVDYCPDLVRCEGSTGATPLHFACARGFLPAAEVKYFLLFCISNAVLAMYLPPELVFVRHQS